MRERAWSLGCTIPLCGILERLLPVTVGPLLNLLDILRLQAAWRSFCHVVDHRGVSWGVELIALVVQVV